MGTFMMVIIMAVFVNNFVLVQFLGICPFLGLSKKTPSAVGMGVAVTVVMTITCLITYPIYTYILIPLGLEYMEIIVFIFVIAALVQMIEKVIKKFSPPLYKAMGIYLPLITTNCAVLGAAMLNIQEGHNFIESVVYGFSSAIGFTLALVIFAGASVILWNIQYFASFPSCFSPFFVYFLQSCMPFFVAISQHKSIIFV